MGAVAVNYKSTTPLSKHAAGTNRNSPTLLLPTVDAQVGPLEASVE